MMAAKGPTRFVDSGGQLPWTPETARQHLQAAANRLKGLSPTAAKVMAICNDPSASPGDLGRILTLDPILAAKVLNLVNSAFFGLPTQISSITRAVVMLGTNTIKNLVLSASVMERLPDAPASDRGIAIPAFWRHSLKTGLIARYIGKETGSPVKEREDLFVAGLLHDIGRLLLNHLLGDVYRDIDAEAATCRDALCRLEADRIGIDHCEAGAVLAERWRLGHYLTEVLGCHHRPESAAAPFHGRVALVAEADALSHVVDAFSGSEDDAGLRLDLPGMPEGVICRDALRNHLDVELERAMAFLNAS